MSFETVRIELIKDAEEYIRKKRQPFDKLSGTELAVAKYHYLEDFQDYINYLNFRINALIDEYLIPFQTLEESKDFQDFMKPTFDMLSVKYTEGLMD